MADHKTITISVRGENLEIDEKVADLVLLMNRIPGLETLSSCQGDFGIIGECGHYGHVAFKYGEWPTLCGFCWDFLREGFLDYIDDEVRVDVFCKTEPYAWLMFRAEMSALVTGRIRVIAHELEGIHAGLADAAAGRTKPFSQIQNELGRR
jgi:hypothetical protein